MAFYDIDLEKKITKKTKMIGELETFTIWIIFDYDKFYEEINEIERIAEMNNVYNGN